MDGRLARARANSRMCIIRERASGEIHAASLSWSKLITGRARGSNPQRDGILYAFTFSKRNDEIHFGAIVSARTFNARVFFVVAAFYGKYEYQ